MYCKRYKELLYVHKLYYYMYSMMSTKQWWSILFTLHVDKLQHTFCSHVVIIKLQYKYCPLKCVPVGRTFFKRPVQNWESTHFLISSLLSSLTVQFLCIWFQLGIMETQHVWKQRKQGNKETKLPKCTVLLPQREWMPNAAAAGAAVRW